MKPKFIKQKEYYIRRMERDGVEVTVYAQEIKLEELRIKNES
ncbi:MAG TPA: hypothetical protein VGB37_16460 [Candidatus Lokiarchaeia archaeon]